MERLAYRGDHGDSEENALPVLPYLLVLVPLQQTDAALLVRQHLLQELLQFTR